MMLSTVKNRRSGRSTLSKIPTPGELARALILDPALLIAEEPTGNLDPANRAVVFDLFQNGHTKGRGIVMITHDAAAAARAKTVYRLLDGALQP